MSPRTSVLSIVQRIYPSEKHSRRSRELVNEAGLYADRLSVNVEIPKEENLKLLAPEKDHKSVYAPMRYIQQGVLEVRKNARNTATLPVSLLLDKAHR